MLLKLFGSLVVIASSSFLGLALSKDCARRPQQLRELQTLLQMFENQISYLSDVLSEAFEKIFRSSNDVVRIFFQRSMELLQSNEGLSASQAWETAVRENIGRTALNREDGEILIAFGKILGNSDLEGQVKNIRLTANQLKLQEQKAEQNRMKNEAMFKNLGILGGLAVVIILI